MYPYWAMSSPCTDSLSFWLLSTTFLKSALSDSSSPLVGVATCGAAEASGESVDSSEGDDSVGGSTGGDAG